eukprot:GFUD01045390.1.p1 GENE.GFUD01045390.1~~GFUD01045390.1.p1  ORF type:complete len:287 (+),score=64.19 GFUD01045390.1:191-1051(+)
MGDKEPVVLNEKGGEDEKDTNLNSDDIVKKLRVNITALKGSYMSDDGSKVDYSQIANSPKFEDYCKTAALLRFIKPELFSEDKRKAFFINIYNSLTVHAMVYQAQIGSLPESPVKVPGFWKIHCYNIGGSVYSLDQIEHGVLRTNKGHLNQPQPPFEKSDPRLKVALTTLDPRIHFALNCGATSCPPIRIYTEERIDNQLQMATRSFISQEVIVANKGEVCEVGMSKLFLWYGKDFGSDHREMLEWVAEHLGEKNGKVTEALQGEFVVNFKDYDWASNLLGEPEGK